MTTDILGRTYKPGRFWKDGSRPYHARTSCQGAEREPIDRQNGSLAQLTDLVNIAHPCPWHAPSKHHMRTWPRVIRFEKYGMVERICVHGIGHPDVDSLAFIGKYIAAGPHPSLGIHGCDGCCLEVGR